MVGEFTFVFLGPGFGIEEAFAQSGNIDGKFLFDGVVDGDFVAREDFGVCPEFVKIISLAVRRADDAQFFQSAAKWVGDGWVDRFPNGFGIIVKSEFRENEIRRVAADGARFRRKRGDA